MCSMPKDKSAGSGTGETGEGTESVVGGPARGPGTAPLNLEEKAPRITSNIVEVLPRQEDSADPVIGQMIGRSARAPSAAVEGAEGPGGGFAEAGSGGEAVWKDTLRPSERRLLEEFFR